MELIYRGIKYKSNSLAVLNSTEKKQTIYQKKSLTPGNSKLPIVRYCKQLFDLSKLTVCHPVKLWNRRKNQYIENCWKIDVVQQLDRCLNILYIEQVKSLPEKPPVQLKYRGVTYYR